MIRCAASLRVCTMGCDDTIGGSTIGGTGGHAGGPGFVRIPPPVYGTLHPLIGRDNAALIGEVLYVIPPPQFTVLAIRCCEQIAYASSAVANCCNDSPRSIAHANNIWNRSNCCGSAQLPVSVSITDVSYVPPSG